MSVGTTRGADVIRALAGLGLMICAILVWSGVAKVRQPEAMASAMGDLRVPGALASKPVQLAIPWVEIGLALLLLVTGGIWQSLASVTGRPNPRAVLGYPPVSDPAPVGRPCASASRRPSRRSARHCRVRP